jgi:hypothetical protein
LTQHISRIMWYQGERKTERYMKFHNQMMVFCWISEPRSGSWSWFWRKVGTFNYYMMQKHK